MTSITTNCPRIKLVSFQKTDVDLHVFDFNQQAIQSYAKAGFIKEGVMREARKFEDPYWNSCIMSILEYEWRDGNN